MGRIWGHRSAEICQRSWTEQSSAICECEYGKELKEIVFEMLQHTHSTAENLYYLQGKLYQFFSVLARGIEIQQYADDTKESIHVQEAIAYIKNYYSQKITVEDIADYLALNRSYLYTIFKNSLGISPKDFLTKFRIPEERSSSHLQISLWRKSQFLVVIAIHLLSAKYLNRKWE